MSVRMNGCGAKRLVGSAILAAASCGAAHAQPLATTDLDGLHIETELTSEQVNRVNGREVSVTVDQTWSVDIGPLASITSTSKAQVRGGREAAPLTGKFRLNQSQQVGSFGGGDAEWSFGEDALTFTRNFRQGAYRLSISLARKGDAFECTATQTFAREDGTGQVTFWSPVARTDITILSWRQVSATCRVSRR